ncbi:MAG TPA: sigma-E factor negative regulatory protein [Steroidobacteraceae bacterium]
MTDQIREQLSALLDGELPRDEIGLLMRRLDRDPELRRSFGSYALIGETLRAPGGLVAGQSFADRVSAAIDAGEAAPATQRATAAAVHSNVAFWKRPAVRTALAASVAAAAVLVLRPQQDSQQQVASLKSVPTSSYSFGSSPTPAQSQRLASYLVAHSQYSTPMMRRNVLTSLLADDPGITRVSYEMGAP